MCDIIQQKLNLFVHYELGNSDTTKILNHFYSDKQRWGYLSQTHFLANKLQTLITPKKDQLCITDRSIYGDSIFVELLYEEKILTEMEYNTYKSLYNSIITLLTSPTLLIYLDCSIDTALQRILKRGRDYEQNISRDYLAKLREKYNNWFNEYTQSPKIYINTDEVDFTNSKHISSTIEQIKTELAFVETYEY